jgi:predicted amidohydrolase
MKLACCQFDIAWEDKAANHDRVAGMLRAAALPAGSLALLPEMFATGFSMKVAGIAEDTHGPTHTFLSQLSRELKLNLLAGVVRTGPNGKGMNEAVAFDVAGMELARYQKLHPFTYAGEDAHYAAGEKIVTFAWNDFNVAPFICYDLRFPEPFRVASKGGVDCFAVLANWPASRELPWVTLLQARAIENQAYVAGVNRCGDDPNARYAGRSLIIDPRGNILADGGTEPGVISAEVDRASLLAFREKFPVLRDTKTCYAG